MDQVARPGAGSPAGRGASTRTPSSAAASTPSAPPPARRRHRRLRRHHQVQHPRPVPAVEGLAVEGDPASSPCGAAPTAPYTGVGLPGRVTPGNVAALPGGYGLPNGFDFLNLDIDGYDMFVLDALLTEYRPRVMCAEVNEKIPPPVRLTVRYDRPLGQDHFYGQSMRPCATWPPTMTTSGRAELQQRLPRPSSPTSGWPSTPRRPTRPATSTGPTACASSPGTRTWSPPRPRYRGQARLPAPLLRRLRGQLHPDGRDAVADGRTRAMTRRAHE